MHNFRELLIWKKARIIVKDIYILTRKFPDEEKFGLTQQVRRAGISFISDIAEGSGRGSNVDFARFIDMSYGSLCEVESDFYIALDLSYITQEDFDEMNIKIQEEEKMMCNFKKSLLGK
jgi:four helix bundle protein